MIEELIGYSDKWSVFPGESISFMVSTDRPNYESAIVRLIHGDENPVGPGFKEEVIEAPRQRTGRKQIAYAGSYITVDNAPALALGNSFTIQAWIYPTLPMKGQQQGIVSQWSPSDRRGYVLQVGEAGDLELWLGDDNGQVECIGTGKAFHAQRWYFVAAAYDANSHKVNLYQLPLTNWPIDESAATTETPVNLERIGANQSPLLIAAAYPETVGENRMVGRATFNGKIDNPCLFSRALNQDEIESLQQGADPAAVAGGALVAAWDFAADIASARVSDRGPHGLHGIAVNMPMRAVTGHNWTATAFDFKYAPEQYGAITFHEDDLDDARWAVDFTWQVPADLKSGVYAARTRAGDQEDYLPFVVRPPKGTATAPVLYLLPTMTYLAYANDRARSFAEHSSGVADRKLALDPLDHYLAEHPEFSASIYDIHPDRSGICYSSRLRPIVSIRPRYKYWVVTTSRHFAADLYLIDWMEQKGFQYDVATDEDLHVDGESLLARYPVIVTGTHPEYWTTPMLTALENYLAHGGRLMYLGGNGFYWVTSVDPERPHIVEVRRGISGTRAWNSAPGEAYHSTTGEMGGLWRHRGKAPNQLVGIGFTAQGWNGRAPGYTRQPDSFNGRAAFIFEGVAPDETIGDFGLVLDGAAGDELDRVDSSLGTPAHTLVLASSSGHDRFTLPVIEDWTEISAALMLGKITTVHADMVYFETPNNGAVFATGSITWCASLSHNNYTNNVSRITENVLRRFSAADH
ncbi:MAG: LamG domain-containing protein [Anaerolineae bacterium]|nr:LamG domain-containing protein [Anaerolineae bacterium]